MKTISIVSIVDVVGTLSEESLAGNLYMMDDNKANGSTDQGTEFLKTKVKEGDTLVWVVQALECEAYVSISGIIIDEKYCEPEQKTYEGTDITYWIGRVKTGVKNSTVPYKLKFKLGSRAEEKSSVCTPFIIIS